MKTRKFASNGLLASIDALNTVNGGVSEPLMSLTQFQDHREIRLKVPGVSEKNLKVEIHNNQLSVFYTIHLTSGDLPMQLPKVVYHNPIPYFVDATRITASADGGFLIVKLPFNALAEGYDRKISIES